MSAPEDSVTVGSATSRTAAPARASEPAMLALARARAAKAGTSCAPPRPWAWSAALAEVPESHALKHRTPSPELEATHPTTEDRHPLPSPDHRVPDRARALAPRPLHRAAGSASPLAPADAAQGRTHRPRRPIGLARARLVAPRSPLRAPWRVARLAHREPALQRRNAIHVQHLPVGWWSRPARRRVSQRAALQGVARLDQGRRLVARVAEHVTELRA